MTHFALVNCLRRSGLSARCYYAPRMLRTIRCSSLLYIPLIVPLLLLLLLRELRQPLFLILILIVIVVVVFVVFVLFSTVRGY